MRIAFAVLLVLSVANISRAELIHHYQFTSNANDSVGTAHLTLGGGANVSGGVLNLDGTGDYAVVGSPIIPVTGSYTLALFARWADNAPRLMEMVSQNGSESQRFFLGMHNDGKMRVSDQWTATGVDYPLDQQFHHFAVTSSLDQGVTRLYIDGVLKATNNSHLNLSASGFTYFGKQYGSLDEYFMGELDDIRIYNNALTAGEIGQIAGVPEPGSLAMAGVAALVWIASRFRRLRESIRAQLRAVFQRKAPGAV